MPTHGPDQEDSQQAWNEVNAFPSEEIGEIIVHQDEEEKTAADDVERLKSADSEPCRLHFEVDRVTGEFEELQQENKCIRRFRKYEIRD